MAGPRVPQRGVHLSTVWPQEVGEEARSGQVPWLRPPSWAPGLPCVLVSLLGHHCL